MGLSGLDLELWVHVHNILVTIRESENVDSYVEPQVLLFKAKNGVRDFNYTDSLQLVREDTNFRIRTILSSPQNERELQFSPSDTKFHEYMLIYHIFQEI